jgi:5-hydroxyisourate hydrolase-like protein (transthyretin family)
MPEDMKVIYGTIVDRNGQSYPLLRVRVLVGQSTLGQGQADGDGGFEVAIPVGVLKRAIAACDSPALTVRAVRGTTLIAESPPVAVEADTESIRVDLQASRARPLEGEPRSTHLASVAGSHRQGEPHRDARLAAGGRAAAVAPPMCLARSCNINDVNLNRNQRGERAMNKSRTKFLSPLHTCMQGEDVEQAQAILSELGLFILSAELREPLFGSTTVEAVLRWTEGHGFPADGSLDLEALDRLWADGREVPRVVHGVVSPADGTPAPGLRVVAIDRDFRAEQELGEARTDSKGRYRITYRAADTVRAEKGAVDVGVRIFAAKAAFRLPFDFFHAETRA